MNSFLASTREQPTGTWMVLFTRSNQVTKCQDVSGFHPKLGTFSRNKGDPGTILESELGPLCPGPLVLHTCKARKRLLQLDLGTSQAGGDQVDHARDVHSPQNPGLSLNRAPQITIFYIHMSRITSRLPRVHLIEKIQQVYWFRGSLLKCKFY